MLQSITGGLDMGPLIGDSNGLKQGRTQNVCTVIPSPNIAATAGKKTNINTNFPICHVSQSLLWATEHQEREVTRQGPEATLQRTPVSPSPTQPPPGNNSRNLQKFSRPETTLLFIFFNLFRLHKIAPNCMLMWPKKPKPRNAKQNKTKQRFPNLKKLCRIFAAFKAVFISTTYAYSLLIERDTIWFF